MSFDGERVAWTFRAAMRVECAELFEAGPPAWRSYLQGLSCG